MSHLALQREPAKTMLATSLGKIVFADVPAELVEPALGVFRNLVESSAAAHPARKQSVLTGGMLTMVAATRAVAAVVPQVSTALTAGVAASAVYHSPHLLDTSQALLGRKTPADWTVGAELVLFYFAALDIVTGVTSAALYKRVGTADDQPVPVG